ncbi:MAG: hypothetical protein JNK53_05480 [Phycisphaerae bacterium]|nr:hypothetical protein [Phycisphaerae bacterium]
MNVQKGVAVCPSCSSISKLESLAASAEVLGVDTDQVPDGCSAYEDRLTNETVLTVTAASWRKALPTWGVAAFWNGITGVFVVIGVRGLLEALGWAQPSQPTSGNGSGAMGLGMSIFMLCFITPFVVVGLAMISTAVVASIGSYTVRVGDATVAVRTGAGPFAWTRRIPRDRIKKVDVGRTTWSQNEQTQPVIVIEHDRTTRVGTLMREDRRVWCAAKLRELVL